MKTITRSQAIGEIRAELMKLVDEDHSICDVAARLGIFCGGFAQWTFQELKKRYPFIVRSRPHITRAELEELANRWQLARQTVMDTRMSCDTQLAESGKQVCHGWDEFDDEEMAAFHAQLCGEEVEVVPDP